MSRAEKRRHAAALQISPRGFGCQSSPAARQYPGTAAHDSRPSPDPARRAVSHLHGLATGQRRAALVAARVSRRWRPWPCARGFTCPGGWRWSSPWASCSSRTRSSTPITARIPSSRCLTLANYALARSHRPRRDDAARSSLRSPFILHPSSFILHPSPFRLPPSAFRLPARRNARRIDVLLRRQQRPRVVRLARLSADRRRAAPGAHHRAAAILAALVCFFPKRACQRRPLFYGVRRLCPPDAAARGTHPFFRIGRLRAGRDSCRRAAPGLIPIRTAEPASRPPRSPTGGGSFHRPHHHRTLRRLTGFPSARP